MGVVDIADQLRLVCTCQMPSRGTYAPLLFWLLFIAATKSYITPLKLDSLWQGSQKKRKGYLAWSLMKEESLISVPARQRSQFEQSMSSGISLAIRRRAESEG